MGFGRGIGIQEWAFILALCYIHQIVSSVNIFQSTLTNPIITSSNPAHNGRVCSTWGNFHFKTFDGDIFYFPGLCNYVFASHCNAPYEDFNIQIRRTVVESTPTIKHIAIKLEGVAVELTKDAVMINGNRVQLPYSQAGITIESSSVYVKVVSKTDVVFMWNEHDSILLELHEKYANQTCGLCGDFNGIPIYNEFYSNNVRMTALQFGNMQKMDGPTEYCEDPTPSSPDNCTDNSDNICQKTLTSSAFADCNDLVDVSDYITACQEDLCRSEDVKNASCICDTFAEYSRQCAHAGGEPLNWRTSKLCPKTCPYNMQYLECSSPCTDTCTNPERSQFCEEHCMDGCFCPPGTVFDDINNSGCISHQQCSCIYNGNTYTPGTSFSDQCHSCICNGGKWSCEDMSCPGICSVEGGSHISTYDKKYYDVHGDCTYVLSKHCEDESFTVLVELRKCGLTSTETCLKTVTLSMNKGQTLIEVKTDGGVFVNSIYTQLPISAANVTIFRPSSFFIIMHTSIGIQVEIQITPIMQVFVRLDPVFKDQTCGLCGNFNDVQTDDFKAMSGVVEGTAAAFANTWKTQASCPNIQNSFENPCALSIDNEKYAQHWCGLLTNSEGPFADCHNALNPSTYHTNCMFDTCNCQNSEGCLCAALSSYVRACAARGIQISGWRTDVCSKYTTSCPKSLSYSYTISSCQPTCRSLSEPDVTCNIKFVPVDGCTCTNGTYMDEGGKCVPANECPCYYRGSPIPLGEVVHENGLVCTCIQGRLNCIGAPDQIPVCESPMFYFDCRNNTAGTTGAECQKSCQTLDMQCYSTQCLSGCVCPSGLVLDGKGGCIPEEECPCIHNGAMYQPGEKINADCNTCVCKDRMWECTKNRCLGTCAVYGDGHYITFDDKRFSFSGNCEYTLVQDHCGKSDTVNGTFRVITENIPCGNTGTTCSKSIKVFLESYELILGEEHVSVVKRGQDGKVPYTVRYMGMYMVVEMTSGLILMWDKKTSLFIKISPDFKGQICGLCGNYDGNGINDFTTRSLSVVENVLEFGNSWKVSSTCPDANVIKDPCSTNPYRKSWSEKQCSILNSNVFAACHSQVEPAKYYQACVTDACACDSGGDCDCFCTAVAAYAQACSEVGVCIAWRTPSICPLFCDYYNQQGECEWHYKPCGTSCMKTCRNPSGKCLHNLPGLEGCYPNCPPDKPYFHEDQMKCVSLCDCYDNEDGKIYIRDECQLCECTSEGLQCKFDDKACNCIYENNTYKYNELIYTTTDGTGWCFRATCDVNGTIDREIFKCGITTTTPFIFSTSQPKTTASEMATTTPVTTVCVRNVCTWTGWYDSTKPENHEESGDDETFQNLREKGYIVCKNPSGVHCRAEEYPDKEISNLNQTIQCDQITGLKCSNKDQENKQCYNYQIRILCCSYIPCSEIQTTTSRETKQITTTATESTLFTVQTMIKPTTPKKETEPLRTNQPTESPTSEGTTAITPKSTPSTAPTTTSTTYKMTSPPSEGTTTTTPTSTVPTSPTSSASTTKTSPPPSEGTTTSTPTSTVPTSPTSSASTTKTSPPPSEGTTTSTPTSTTTTRPTTTSTTSQTSPPPTASVTTLSPAPTVPTSPIATVNTSTTGICQQLCAWTQWFDVDSPASGIPGGDYETFANIRNAGFELCTTPQDIKCRAENYPDRSLESLGQKLKCSRDVGLVCINEDQIAKYPMCFNYQVSVLCCDRKHCETPTAPPGTTAKPTATEISTAPTQTTAVSTTSPTLTGSTKAGTPVLIKTTSSFTTTTATSTPAVSTSPTSSASTTRTSPPPSEGTTTTTPTSTVPTSPTSSASTTRTSQPPTEGTTTSRPTSTVPTSPTSSASTSRTTSPPSEGTTTSTPTSTPSTTPTSSSATSTSSSHPAEFSTTISPTPTVPTSPSSTVTTSFLTRTLAPVGTTSVSSTKSTLAETSSLSTRITTQLSSASTLSESTLSSSSGSTVVPETSSLPTRGTTIITTTPTESTSRTSSKGTSETTTETIRMSSTPSIPVETSTLATQTPASPTTASTLSHSTMTSNVGSTVIFPTSISSTSRSSATSVFPTSFTTTSSSAGTSQSSHITTSTSAVFSSSVTTAFTTETSTNITSSGTTPCFCHVFGDLFSPGEVVYNRTDKAGCNFYALCSTECEIVAFQGPCPITTPVTSESLKTTIQTSSSTEIFSSISPTTATSLTTPLERNCTDVNPPRKPGEKWISECQDCVCDPLTASVQCQQLPCQTPQTAICDVGFISTPVIPVKDICCPEFECRRIPDVCVVNGNTYKVGMSVIDSCKNCTCSSEKDPVTGENIVQCERIQCETSCPLGYGYKIEDGECCGKCFEEACKIQLSNNTVRVLNVDEILPLDPCSHYKCEKIEDQFVAVQTKKICPELNPTECDPDEAETTPDGCCKICKPTNCKAYSTKTVVRHEDCESSEAVELTYCEGTCPGSSMYSLEANQMQHECSCCQEFSSHTREVTLTCQNGTNINYNYVYVEECQCVNACNSQTLEEDGYQSKTGGRWT